MRQEVIPPHCCLAACFQQPINLCTMLPWAAVWPLLHGHPFLPLVAEGTRSEQDERCNPNLPHPLGCSNQLAGTHHDLPGHERAAEQQCQQLCGRLQLQPALAGSRRCPSCWRPAAPLEVAGLDLLRGRAEGEAQLWQRRQQRGCQRGRCPIRPLPRCRALSTALPRLGRIWIAKAGCNLSILLVPCRSGGCGYTGSIDRNRCCCSLGSSEGPPRRHGTTAPNSS